jgi:phosphopentomutase
MGGYRSSIRSSVPPPEFSIHKPFKVVSPFKDKAFLHQKYVVERLSCEEIARQISSSRTTVLKWLKLSGIKTRRSDYKNTGNNIPFGTTQKEMKVIEKMRVLRQKGYSFWKIAEILNAMGTQTKTSRGKWQARTIQRVLDNSEGKVV